MYAHFFDEDVSLSTKVFISGMFTDNIFQSNSKNNKDIAEYGRVTCGLKETIYVTLSDDLMTGYFYSFKYSKLDDDKSKYYDSRHYYFEDSQGGYITSSIGSNIIFNNTDRRRDSLSISGVSGNLMLEGAGLGGHDIYLKSSLAFSVYKSFFDDDVIFKLHNTAEHISGLNSQVRIPNRLSLGDNSFRGFADYGLGPRYVDNKEFAGGNFSWTSSLDMLFSIPVTEEGSSFGFNGIVFTQFGNLYGDWKEPGRKLLTQDNGLRMSVGFGVMIRNPILPCVIYYGMPIIKSNDDNPFSLSFKFGYNF
jgi:outer membrane protein insertion porin family